MIKNKFSKNLLKRLTLILSTAVGIFICFPITFLILCIKTIHVYLKIEYEDYIDGNGACEKYTDDKLDDTDYRFTYWFILFTVFFIIFFFVAMSIVCYMTFGKWELHLLFPHFKG